MTDTYPSWICGTCGNKHGKALIDRIATFHTPDKFNKFDLCGWCGTREQALTEPRDFGHPPAPRFPPIVVIDESRKRCNRYASGRCTHILEVAGEITAEKVERIRLDPDSLAGE